MWYLKKKKRLMVTWEDLEKSRSLEDDEQANICLMTNTAPEKSKIFCEKNGIFHNFSSPRSPQQNETISSFKNQASCALVFEIEPKNIEEALKDDDWIITMEDNFISSAETM
ncbi:hypothetical protein CR513_45905, partial [Mucuna pruriens]